MESIPLKKPRLELPKTSVDKRDGVLCEEIIVKHMDIIDDERVSHLCEKEPEMDKTPRLNISSPNRLIAEKACHSYEIPKQNIDQLFQRYIMASNRKPKNMILVPGKYHQWGILSKIKEISGTLSELTNVTLENISNCKETFIKILEELQFEYNIVEIKSLKSTGKSLKSTGVCHVFAFDIKSVPNFTFCGYGATKDIAIHLAAKNGLEFFFESCQ